MDTVANEALRQLQQQMQRDAIVKDAEELQVGDIVYYDMDSADGITLINGYVSRLKYVVIAGAKSNLNDHSLAPDWQAEQYLIRQDDYPEILDRDSWIDCTDPKELKVSKIKAKKAEKKGHLNDRDLANVMKHLKENDFIDNHTRKVYGIDKYQLE